MTHHTMGIDISKDKLDAFRQVNDGAHQVFANDRQGLAALRKWIGTDPFDCFYGPSPYPKSAYHFSGRWSVWFMKPP